MTAKRKTRKQRALEQRTMYERKLIATIRCPFATPSARREAYIEWLKLYEFDQQSIRRFARLFLEHVSREAAARAAKGLSR